MNPVRICIVGAGNMGSALVQGILTEKLVSSENITVTNRSHGKLESLQQRWNINVTYDNAAAAADADLIVLSVKPSEMRTATKQIRPVVAPHQLLVSIAAGISIHTIKWWLEQPLQPVVRVMPNTPSQIGHGMAGWSASAEVTDSQRTLIQGLLRALGRERYFADEKLLDQVTAVSASGPAYIFYMAEVLMKAGEAIGLTPGESQELVLQTIYGAAEMLRSHDDPPAVLRAAVTSKGGTTEAALRQFTLGELEAVISRGVRAAYLRSEEIGNQWHEGEPPAREEES